jgi:surface antigen
MTKRIIPALVAVFTLTACAQGYDQYGNPIQTQSMMAPAVGAVGVGAISGLACSPLGKGNGKTAIVGACSMLGGIAGLLMGNQYSQQQQVARAYQAPRVPTMRQPAYQQPAYQQPPYEEEGQLSLGQSFSNPNTGELCREFQHRAKVGGRIQQVYGTACQQRDGTWKVVS